MIELKVQLPNGGLNGRNSGVAVATLFMLIRTKQPHLCFDVNIANGNKSEAIIVYMLHDI